jgi:hypothetical protein
MALPTAYLTSVKNVPAILEAVRNAQAPDRFTQKYLEGLGFPSSTDRLIINVLKQLGFLNDQGAPLQRYFDFLDTTQSKRVLAEGIRDAYADLFQVNKSANEMTVADLKNKMRTLTQGQASDDVLQKMATTFKALVGQADFTASAAVDQKPAVVGAVGEITEVPGNSVGDGGRGAAIGGLVYTINIVLPESRDQAVYDALFRSLKDHLIR